jgi:2-dehydropantoate 2-reductase
MRHAFLGAGGVGGLIAAALAHNGETCVLLLRPETLANYPGRLMVKSAVLGDFNVDIPATSTLDREVDVVWVAAKATKLEDALVLAPASRVDNATVIPLMNGIDHVALLRERYPSVVAGAIRVESERLSPNHIEQRSPFLRVELAGGEPVAAALRDAGIECLVDEDESSLLWNKLTFLAPIALATTALNAPLGDVRDDERFKGCREESLAVARAEGARVDAAALVTLHQGAPAGMRSSMQKDVAAGRQPELDAIAGPILRASRRHGLSAPSTENLAALVTSRLAEAQRR